MKTFLMLFSLILFPILIYPQINPDEFPKIGYFDMYSLTRVNSQVNYSDSSWFYPALLEMGLTHVNAFHPPTTEPLINRPPYNTNFNSNLKVIDGAIERATIEPYYLPYRYIHSAVNYIDHFPYEAGGENIALITSKDDNFGFGNSGDPTPNDARTSWWIYSYNNECIGDKAKEDLPLHPGTIVHFAQVGDTTGVLLKAKPDSWHLPYDNRWGNISNYRLRILARIDGDLGSVNVAKVRIWEEMPGDPLPDIQNHYEVNSYMEGEGETLDLTDYTYFITANEFGGNEYVDLPSPATWRKTHSLEHQDGASNLWITIEWLGTRNLYIDKISIDNTMYDELFIQNSQVVRNNIKIDLENLYGSVKTNSLFAHPYKDEPFPIFYRGVREVSNLAELPEVLGIGKYVNGATLSLSNDLGMMANSQRRLPYVLYDLYPITENTSTSSSGPNNLQTAFDNLVYNYWGSPGYGVERYNGLRAGIELAQNFTPIDPTDDIPFFHTIQVSSQKNLQNGQWVEPYRYRAPTYNEILAQGNLALCYGAKGIMYFLISTITPNSGVAFYGLFEQYGVPPGTLVQDPTQPQCRNERYWAVKELNQDISLIEDELITLTWRDAFSFHKEEERNRLYLYLGSGHFITDLKSYKVYEGIPEIDPLSQSFVEVGVFKKTSEYENNLLEYFMLVNRRGLETEGRTYEVTYNQSGTQYVNWSVTDIATSDNWSGLANNMFAVYVDPGKGKLFSLEPTAIGGGSLLYDEIIESDIDLKRDLIIESGVTLTVNATYNVKGNITIKDEGSLKTTGNGKIYFHNHTRIITEGVVVINGEPTNKLELDFIEPHHMNGINVETGSALVIYDCVIKNSRNGIKVESGASWINVAQVDFENCIDACINISGPNSSSSPILNNTFLNSNAAISAVNLSEISIYENVVQNCNLGFYLSNVTTPLIVNNTLTSTLNSMPGIFLESCNGIVRGNSISGFTNGIHLGNSSPDIGGNEITDNLYHGIYVGFGSLPNMEARLYSNPPEYYAISGYNDIKENGGTTTGGPFDNDGSEIFFSSSNALMREGCNSICDDRSGGEHPYRNTKLLMNGIGFGGSIEVKAEQNYWCDNPLYPLEERFGNLIVYFEPVLPEPCEIPGGSGEELFVKSSSGEIIDTLYPVPRTIGTLSNTDLLYASAEEKFITADYDIAEELYNQIVIGNDSLVAKLQAYRRLYEIGKLNSKPTSYFNNLYSVYSSISQSTEDSLIVKIFTQLSSLSLVGEEEIIPAVEEFDNVIQQNPGSEEAIYAEIDALTTALLIENGDSTLGKSAAANYIVDNNEYNKRIMNILIKNFGAESDEKEKDLLPTEYTLYQNYPNPFNPVTTIKYDLPNAGNVELVVYDILGRKVKTLVNQTQQAGKYEVSFNAGRLASGVYIYQLRAKDFVSSKKMILLK